MWQVDHISLAFEDNGRLHDDWVLRIGTSRYWCDSYFLWCEDPKSGSDQVPVVKRVLAQLTSQWTTAGAGATASAACSIISSQARKRPTIISLKLSAGRPYAMRCGR